MEEGIHRFPATPCADALLLVTPLGVASESSTSSVAPSRTGLLP